MLIIPISVLLAATKRTKFVFDRGSAPDTTGGDDDAPQTASRLGRGTPDTPSPFPSPSTSTGPSFSRLRRSPRRFSDSANYKKPIDNYPISRSDITVLLQRSKK